MVIRITLSITTFGSLAVLQRATTTNGISYASIPLLVFAAVAQEQVTVHSSATLCPYSFTYLSFAALFSASPLSLTFGSMFKAGRLIRKLLYVFILTHVSRFFMYFLHQPVENSPFNRGRKISKKSPKTLDNFLP